MGSPSDPEATGDGSGIGILKRLRTLSGTQATLLGTIAAAGIVATAVVVSGRLTTAPAVATAAAPTYTEGSSVPLSTDLAGTLRASTGGGGGGNPSGGWLDSVGLKRHASLDTVRYLAAGRLDSTAFTRRAAIDTLRYLAAGQLDSVAFRRRAAIDTIRYLLAGRLDSTAFTRRAALDTLRYLTAGRLDSTAFTRRAAIDTLRYGIVADTIRDRASVSTGGTIGAVQLGSTTGKTNVYLTGSLTTTAVTADQVILTRTVTAGKTFYVSYACLQARLTAVSATGAILGAASIETPSGTKIVTMSFTNPTTEWTQPTCVPMVEPLPVAAAAVIRCVTTPAATTSTLWICNFGGYEK